MSGLEDIHRKKEVVLFNETATYYEGQYGQMPLDYHFSSFTYGRKKLEILLDEIVKKLPPKSRILDVGCGTGYQLKWFRDRGFDVSAIEPSSEMRAIAQDLNPGALILDGAASALPFPDEMFDLVLAIEVLRYLPSQDLKLAYAEMLRVLKPGGRLFFTMVNRFSLTLYYFYHPLKKLIQRETEHCEFVTPGEVRRDLEALGAKRIEFQGRMVIPFRFGYMLNHFLGVRMARVLEPLDDSLSRKPWALPLAGHLVVMAER
jgi:SAM-dependent methyltransferase